jgi:hypothetical protein
MQPMNVEMASAKKETRSYSPSGLRCQSCPPTKHCTRILEYAYLDFWRPAFITLLEQYKSLMSEYYFLSDVKETFL